MLVICFITIWCKQLLILKNQLIIITQHCLMGQSQAAQHYNSSNIHQLFPTITQFKPISNSYIHNSHNFTQMLYTNLKTNQVAAIKNYEIFGHKKAPIQMYYLTRTKINNNPHVFQLIDSKITLNKNNKSAAMEKSIDVSSTLCTMRGSKMNMGNLDIYTLWLLVQSTSVCLQDQILNRVNKKNFEEIQIWSVLSSCVLGAITLLENGFKEPVLSPKGIGLTKDGVIKVGEWELVSNMNQDYFKEQGQVIFGKFGHQVSQTQKNSLNQLLLNYYWAPQGLRAMENLMALGEKTPHPNGLPTQKKYIFNQNNVKFQIFSLGMSLISMCLRSCFYRADTFSEKYLQKLTHQAIQIRKVEGKQLSPELKYIIQSMVKWDHQQRISYTELRDLILQYFSDHPQEMKNSSVSLRTFEFISQSDQGANAIKKIKSRTQSLSSHSSMNLTEEQSFVDAYSFAMAQAGLKFRNNLQKIGKYHSKEDSQHLCSTGSAFDGYEGSGMVEQGTGDNDQNLQDQIKQQNQCQDQMQSKPVTHRANKSFKSLRSNKKKSSLASPLTKKSENNRNVCPNSTPYLAPSPIANRNPYLYQYSNSIEKYPKQQIQFSKPDEPRTNQVYLNGGYKNLLNEQVQVPRLIKNKQKGSIHTQFNHNESYGNQMNEDYLVKSNNSLMMSNNENRGSYRSSYKQPPKINSARPLANLNDYLNLSNNQHGLTEPLRPTTHLQNRERDSLGWDEYGRSSLSSKNVGKHEIIIQYANGYPNSLKQLARDEEDEPDIMLQYRSFENFQHLNQERQNPDIFEENQELLSEPSLIPDRKIMEDYEEENKQSSRNILKPVNLTKMNIQLPSTSKIKEKQIFESNQNQLNHNQFRIPQTRMQNTQFMTFNQVQSVEDNINRIDFKDLVPSKWKTSLSSNQLQFVSNKSQESSLFTDPKILQYIRSPFKKSGQNSSQGTSRFNPNELIKTTQSINHYENQQQDYVRSSFKGKQNQTNYINGYNCNIVNENKYLINDFKLDSNELTKKSFESDSKLCSLNKIVKEKVSKGFYEGEKKNGMRCGYGVFYYNEGGKYKGNWLNNQMHGKGTLQYADGRVAYQGDWHCDQLHGKGVLYNQSPNFITESLNYYDLDEFDECWIYYQGAFQHDDKSGQGLLLLSNHEQFMGEFKNDMADGVGEYLRMDGTVVKGVWRKNKLVDILQQ